MDSIFRLDDYWLPHHLKHIVYAMHDTEEKAVLYFSDIEHNANEKGGSYWDFCGFSISGRYESDRMQAGMPSG